MFLLIPFGLLVIFMAAIWLGPLIFVLTGVYVLFAGAAIGVGLVIVLIRHCWQHRAAVLKVALLISACFLVFAVDAAVLLLAKPYASPLIAAMIVAIVLVAPLAFIAVDYAIQRRY
jgi:hypothetical protein